MAAEAPVPPLVAAATARARQAGFPMSCHPAVGRLLAVLAAHLPEGARVLELGTGTGVGTAWMVSGLMPRTDVSVTSVEKDPGTAAAAAGGYWPPFVSLRCDDALDVLKPRLGNEVIGPVALGAHRGVVANERGPVGVAAEL